MGCTSPPRPRPAVVRDLAGRGHHVEQPAPPGRNRDLPLPHPVQGRLCQPRAGPGGPAATETERPGRSAPGAAGPAFPQPPGACLPVPLWFLAPDPQAPVPRGGGPLVVGLRLWWTSAPWPARSRCQWGWRDQSAPARAGHGRGESARTYTHHRATAWSWPRVQGGRRRVLPGTRASCELASGAGRPPTRYGAPPGDRSPGRQVPRFAPCAADAIGCGRSAPARRPPDPGVHHPPLPPLRSKPREEHCREP